MANIGQPLAEVFGHLTTDHTDKADRYRSHRLCPFNNKVPNWIQNFESKHEIQLNKLATDEMNSQKSLESLNPLPLGRSFDMMLFLL